MWASCATLLKDLSKEEQAKAAYLVLNDGCISTFLPSSSPEPPSPKPTSRRASPQKQTNKPSAKTKQTTEQSVVGNKQKETRGRTEVKKEAAVEASRRQMLLKKKVAAKAKAGRATSMSAYKGQMKLRVKQEPKDPLFVNNQSQAQTKAKTAPQKSILKKRNDPKRTNINIKRERTEDSVRQNSRKNGSTKVNIKKEFGLNGRRPNKRFRCYNDVQRSELNRTFDISAYPSTQVISFISYCGIDPPCFRFVIVCTNSTLSICFLFFFKTLCFRTAEGLRVNWD